MRDKNAGIPDTLDGKTVVIEFARGGPDGTNPPLPTDGDLCEEGTFYTDHPEGDAKAMTELMELEAYIDANYRTKAPADLPFTE